MWLGVTRRPLCQICARFSTAPVSGQDRQLWVGTRTYALPANVRLPPHSSLKAPPAPSETVAAASVEDAYKTGHLQKTRGSFDLFLDKIATQAYSMSTITTSELFLQYRERSGRVIASVVPYEERPKAQRRADSSSDLPERDAGTGDGMVMVVHALMKPNGKLDKICACSGFVVNAQDTKAPIEARSRNVIISCAHTLEEMHRHILKAEMESHAQTSFSFVISSSGEALIIDEVLASMPRSDVIALQTIPSSSPTQKRLRSLPLSPYPVRNGSVVLTHTFGAPGIPDVNRSLSRLPPSPAPVGDVSAIEKPIPWLAGKAWRRWGCGHMLGYRSYTGIEVGVDKHDKAGLHSSLPHIMTSILPTAGSSGGPLLSGETGAVVGMISGRRMDNRVEGERGWGTSAEGIFEMFSLPGFTPTHLR